jgi:hypothetical protein
MAAADGRGVQSYLEIVLCIEHSAMPMLPGIAQLALLHHAFKYEI